MARMALVTVRADWTNVSLASKATVAKNQNTFEKRRREIEKKQRAEDKRKRRQTKKDVPSEPSPRTGEPEDYGY